MDLYNYKYGFGPLSKNIVDACIDHVNKYNLNLSLIPSRRQLDYDSGYSNNWTTKTFSEYVKKKTNKIFLKRDHGGPNQGNFKDDGKLSLEIDCLYFHCIHIDPWRIAKTFKDGCELTKSYIQHCYKLNKEITYEIGTEESIFKYEASDLDYLLSFLKKELSIPEFNNIKYAVIQCGTSLAYNTNTGKYNRQRLLDMIKICKKYYVNAKEHNGDYLPIDLIHEKFDNGLDLINIAPEFGQIETNVYLNEVKNTELFNIYFDLCFESKKWEKWVDIDFNPKLNKTKTINICGHYLLSNEIFLNKIKSKIRKDIDDIIKNKVTERLDELYVRFKT
jgi:hypothetical protein